VGRLLNGVGGNVYTCKVDDSDEGREVGSKRGGCVRTTWGDV
jgi:hypothetical protein